MNLLFVGMNENSFFLCISTFFYFRISCSSKNKWFCTIFFHKAYPYSYYCFVEFVFWIVCSIKLSACLNIQGVPTYYFLCYLHFNVSFVKIGLNA